MISPSAHWVRFLPEQDQLNFLAELVATLEVAEPSGVPAPVAQLITEWRHTAEVHADPALLAALSQDGADFGEIPGN